ncbi:MAG: hypothetical protein AB1595_07685 [bacterium]
MMLFAKLERQAFYEKAKEDLKEEKEIIAIIDLSSFYKNLIARGWKKLALF